MGPRHRGRGGAQHAWEDFLFDSGQDLAVGYDGHDRDAVHLYLQESFSFVAATPEAVVPLQAASRRSQRTRKQRS